MTDSSNPPPRRTPATGCLLGVDYGTKRVGLAISTPDQTIASPMEILQRKNERLDGNHLKEMTANYRVVGIVVGLPIHVNGSEGEKAREARQYGAWLEQLCGLPVDFWDERFTSAVAEEYLLGAEMTRQQRKKRLDMIAAQIMLQSFLKSNEIQT